MGKNKQIAKNIVYNSISFGVNMIISFFFTPYLIKVVGKEAYGFFPLVNSLIGYSTIITSAISSMAGVFLTNAYYKGKIKETTEFFNSVFVAYVFLSVVFMLIGLIVIIYIEDVLTVPDYLVEEVRWLFLFALLGLVVNLSFNVFGLGTYMNNRIDLSSVRETVTKVMRVVFIITLFSLFRPSIMYMSLSAFLAFIIGAIYNLFFKHRFLHDIPFAPIRYFSFDKIWQVVSAGIWTSVNQLSNIFSTSIDLLITNIFISAMATSDFSIAKTVPMLIGQIVAMLSSTFYPNFNIRYAKGEKTEMINDVKRSMTIMTFLISIPLGFFIVDSDFFFQLWVPDSYNIQMFWLSFISLSPLIFSITTTPIYGVYSITNNRKVPALVLLVIGGMNIVFVYILLKTTSLGVYAIALVSAVLLGIRNIVFTPVYGARCLGIKLNTFFPDLIKGVLSVTFVIAITMICRRLVVNVSWLYFLSSFLVISILSMVVNYFFLLNKSERLFIKKKTLCKLGL